MIIPPGTKSIKIEVTDEGRFAVFLAEDESGALVETSRVRTTSDCWSSEFVFCDCGAEAVSVQVLDDDPDDQLAYLSFYEYGNSYPRTIRERLRHAWRVLRTGNPYNDQVCLKPSDLSNLASALLRAKTVLDSRKKQPERKV